MTPGKSESQKLDTAATYIIGNTTVSIARIFREENAETLTNIIVKLIKKDAEKP